MRQWNATGKGTLAKSALLGSVVSAITQCRWMSRLKRAQHWAGLGAHHGFADRSYGVFPAANGFSLANKLGCPTPHGGASALR